jgi:hypothetical protein
MAPRFALPIRRVLRSVGIAASLAGSLLTPALAAAPAPPADDLAELQKRRSQTSAPSTPHSSTAKPVGLKAHPG